LIRNKQIDMKTKTLIKWVYVNGLKQSPKDLDFCITPTLKFARADKEEVSDLGNAWGLCIEWGHWAFGFGVFNAYVR
jgi:hypothetical protein